MKNIKKFLIKQLVLAAVLFTVTVGYAQVVSVPAGCIVVVAGTGGTLGAYPTGKVGDNGVVIMADPSGGGKFTFSGTAATTASWHLKGDLSNTAVSPSAINNVPPQPIASLSANIFTCNKFLRATSSEGTNPSWARSKGQVKVTWTVAPCNSSIIFDIFKVFNNIPAIVGPTCLEPDKEYTFSIDQIASDNSNDNIGFDKYYWDGYQSNINPQSLYFSADNSSITFKTKATGLAPFTLKVCVGRYNTTSNADGGNGPNYSLPASSYLTCTTRDLILMPTAPEYIAGFAPPTCHPTGSASFNIVYPNVVAPQVNTWTAPNTDWIISAPVVGTTNTTVTVTTPTNNPGGLVLTISGTVCGGTVIIPYQVNRSLTGTIIAPNTTSPGSTCMLAGSSNNQFFLGANASANYTTWTLSSVPPGATGVTLASVSGQPSSTVAVNIAPTATINATYTLTATANTSPACTATSSTFNFYVKPSTPSITGTSCVVKGAITAKTYTCTASTGASYNWVFPVGWTANSFTTATNSITVTPANATAVLNGNATVTAIGLNGCNSAISSPFPINYLPVAPILGATNCMSVGSTSASVVLTNFQNFGTYTVTSVPLGITSSGVVTGGNLALTIPPTLAAGNYNITVNHVALGSCGTASFTLPNVAVSASAAAWAAGFPSYDATSGGSDVYRVNSQPAGTTYQWYSGPTVFTTISALTLIPSPGSNPNASFSPSGNQMTLYGATALANPHVYCLVTPPGGCATVISVPKGTHGITRQVNPNVKNLIERVAIYPNPNDGNFTIQVDTIKETASATLTDMTGKKLGTYNLVEGENKITNKNLATGTYLVIMQIDGKTESRKLIVK